MRPTFSQEIIFEGALEARVAAQLLNDAGRSDLVEAVVPPIDPPSIGRIEFVSALSNEQKGRGDATDYVCPSSASVEVIKILAQVAEITPPGQSILSRKKYMGQKLVEFSTKLADMESQPRRPNVVEVGGMNVVGASDEQVDLLKRREAFVNQFLTERGWDKNDLSIEQLLEVRKQPGWQDPPELI
jgi:hypothetical protein